MSDLIQKQDAIDVKAEFLNEQVIRETEEQTSADRAYAKGWNECNRHWIEAIKELPSAQQWIPCSERPPKEGVEVLICDIDGDIYCTHMTSYKEFYDWGDDKIKNVIAWMPKPKPYEGKKDE